MQYYSQLSESAIVAEFYKNNLDEGLGDVLKKAVASIKKINSTVKDFIIKNANSIAQWANKNILEPLQDHIHKFVPGYKWGSHKDDPEGLIESVIKILSKSAEVTESSDSDYSFRETRKISEGVKRYIRQINLHERRNVVVESGAVGAVLSVIHWSHFAVDLLEITLKAAPSIPFLAGIASKLLKVTEILKSNSKLSKLVHWWEHGKIFGLPAKDVVNAICLTVGVIEIMHGAGIAVLITTSISAGWIIGEKLWHLYKKHSGDKEAKAIKESFFQRGFNPQYS